MKRPFQKKLMIFQNKTCFSLETVQVEWRAKREERSHCFCITLMIKAARAKTPTYSFSLKNLTVIEVSIFTQHLSLSLLSPCYKRQRSNKAWAFLVSACFDARHRPPDRGNVMACRASQTSWQAGESSQRERDKGWQEVRPFLSFFGLDMLGTCNTKKNLFW